MVFNGQGVILALSSFAVIWLCILTILVYRMIRHYNQLTRGASSATLKEILDTILGKQISQKQQVNILAKAVANLEEHEQVHLQRIGVVRFNPFSDTGGNQSFTLALLDRNNNGIVMTSLYARVGNRWYIKHVKAGKGVDIELAAEEESAIKKAVPIAHMTM